MKNNLSFIISVMAIVALFGLVVALYGVNSTAGSDGHALDGKASGSGTGDTSQINSLMSVRLPDKPPSTALGAFSAAAWQQQMRSWADGKQNLSVVSVSTDTGVGGESPYWKINVYGDDEFTTFYVEDGQIADVVKTSAAGGKAPATDLSKVIDSDRAWELALQELHTDAGTVPAVSMSLKTMGDRPCWNIILASEGGLQIIRIDAVTETILQTATVG